MLPLKSTYMHGLKRLVIGIKVRQSGYLASKIVQFWSFRVSTKIQSFKNFMLKSYSAEVEKCRSDKNSCKKTSIWIEMYKILSESKIGLMPTAVFAGGIAANIRLLKLLELVLACLRIIFPI